MHVRCLTAGVSGTAMVLLQGSGIDSVGFSYKHVIELLALNHRVFASAWPGYGKSD